MSKDLASVLGEGAEGLVGAITITPQDVIEPLFDDEWYYDDYDSGYDADSEENTLSLGEVVEEFSVYSGQSDNESVVSIDSISSTRNVPQYDPREHRYAHLMNPAPAPAAASLPVVAQGAAAAAAQSTAASGYFASIAAGSTSDIVSQNQVDLDNMYFNPCNVFVEEIGNTASDPYSAKSSPWGATTEGTFSPLGFMTGESQFMHKSKEGFLKDLYGKLGDLVLLNSGRPVEAKDTNDLLPERIIGMIHYNEASFLLHSDSNRLTPLMIAIESKDISVIDALLNAIRPLSSEEKTPYLDAQDNYSDSAVTRAINAAREDILESLIDAGASINTSHQGFTPLMIACQTDNLAIVNILLANLSREDLETTVRYQGEACTALELAVMGGVSLEVIDTLITHNASLNNIINTIIDKKTGEVIPGIQQPFANHLLRDPQRHPYEVAALRTRLISSVSVSEHLMK